MDCLFCAISEGEIPSHTIYKDEHAVAFLDIHPLAPGHTVVIPRIHSETILDFPEAEMQPFFKGVKTVTARLQKTLKPDGFTMGINHGTVSGQSVNHLHFHIIPRWNNDKGGSLHSVVHNQPKESVEEVAQKIRAAISS